MSSFGAEESRTFQTCRSSAQGQEPAAVSSPYAAIFTVRSTSTGTAAEAVIDVSDEPEDLSVRTGAYHVTTMMDTGAAPTCCLVQQTLLQGEVFCDAQLIKTLVMF